MAAYRKNDAPQTHRAQLNDFTVDDLKKMAKLFSKKLPTRKADLIDVIVAPFEGDKNLRLLWEKLDALQQAAVAETVYAEPSVFDARRFHARHGARPDWGQASRWGGLEEPSLLRVFLPNGTAPSDLKARLKSFVSPPPVMTVSMIEQLPEYIEISRIDYDRTTWNRKTTVEKHPLVQAHTERTAQHDLRAVLRLIDTRKIQVTPKTKRIGKTGLKAVGDVLSGEDYYVEEYDERDYKTTPGPIKAFAWPMILQSGDFVETAGQRLQLTPAGRKALMADASSQLRTLWRRWLKTTVLDEFNRVDDIKGQTGRGKHNMTSAAGRRKAVVEALSMCAPHTWLSIDYFFRFMIANDYRFEVTRDPWDLYISDAQYGSLGYDGFHDWHILQGRYVLAFLFEYAATMGLIDIAYIDPDNARRDFGDLWGTDDMTFLSRYDGLQYFRINALGAWILGLADRYTPSEPEKRVLFKVLPTMEIVAVATLQPGDRLFLDQIGKQTSDHVWKLQAECILEACEQGQSVPDMIAMLKAGCAQELPQTIEVFFEDLLERFNSLADAGPARLIAVNDPALAHTIVHDARLREHCMLAGDRYIVVPAHAEKTFRRELRAIGYGVKPQGDQASSS